MLRSVIVNSIFKYNTQDLIGHKHVETLHLHLADTFILSNLQMGQVRVQCLAEGYCSTPKGGAMDLTTNPTITKQPTLPPELCQLAICAFSIRHNKSVMQAPV